MGLKGKGAYSISVAFEGRERGINTAFIVNTALWSGSEYTAVIVVPWL